MNKIYIIYLPSFVALPQNSLKFIHKVMVLQVPNGVGGLLGIAQLILYAIYYKDKGKTKNSTTDKSTEMGLAGCDHKSGNDEQKLGSEYRKASQDRS